MVKPGRYRHFKGKEYEVIAFGNVGRVCGIPRIVRRREAVDPSGGDVERTC